MSLVSDLFTSAVGTDSQFEQSQASLYQVDHRKFVMQHCDSKARARRESLEAAKRKSGLIRGLEKLAGIEGTGVVQEALDAIVSATHVGGTEWEKIVDGGAEGILTSVVGEQAGNLITGIMNDISPHLVNVAVESAKQVYDKVKERDLDWRDIPQYVADFKNLWELGNNIIDPFFESNAPNTEPVTACSASPYAMDLISTGVKFKFLFVVEFNFNPAYLNLQNVSPAYVVKTADRPSIQYEYDDINMYNFRTKIAKKATFAPLNLSFYDDEKNHAVAFYNGLLRAMTPIANASNSAFYEQTGMEFGQLQTNMIGPDAPSQGVPTYGHAASISPLIGNNTSIIDSITLHHVYRGGQRVNRYTFHRPRVVNMALDQLDMASGDTTELRLEFVYDGLEIENNDATALLAGSDNRLDQNRGMLYPLGGEGSSVEIPSMCAIPTQAPAGLAELYADGQAYIEGYVSGATKMAGDAYTSISGAATGVWNSITGGASTTTASTEHSALQERARQTREALKAAGLKGTVEII